MSNHMSKKAILLHHSQVEAGRERVARRSRERTEAFLFNRSLIKSAIMAERFSISWIAFCFFVCISFISISYLGWAY